jgi:hypothetical protein
MLNDFTLYRKQTKHINKDFFGILNMSMHYERFDEAGSTYKS